MIRQILTNIMTRHSIGKGIIGKEPTFCKIVGYEGIKRTFVRSLNSQEPVHILLIGQPGHAKTLFLKCILETFGEKKAFFAVGGNASKSGLIDVLFNTQPSYLLIDGHFCKEISLGLFL
jgi:DNA replicative helicase MCM subunit Mcm2 (Cdc46/Mcm family)